jgi:N-acyl homoserine lactone hydrolase
MRLYLLRLGVMTGIQAPIPAYLIRTDDGVNVLVDSGFGPGGVRDERISVEPEHDISALLAGLGVRPADVHYVVCSHLDPDHAGNHVLFGGAEFVIQRAHYELAKSGAVPRIERTRTAWDRPELKYRLVDGDTELLPGIELVESSGHVRGHQSVLVRLPNTGPVLLAVDAIPVSAALSPDDRPVFPFDLDADDVRQSTKKLVELSHREKAFIVHGHDGDQWSTLKLAPEYYD